MSHLALALALSLALACSKPMPEPAEPDPAVSGSQPAEPGAAEPAAAEPAAAGSSGIGSPTAEPAAAVPQTLFVAPALAECQGEAPQQCLQVRESEAEPYRRWYTGIAGFEYEPGYEYELRVAATAVPNAPADASAVSYRLLEVVAKRKVPAGAK